MRKDPGKQRVKGKGFLFAYSSEAEVSIVLGKAKKQEHEAGLAARNQRDGIHPFTGSRRWEQEVG